MPDDFKKALQDILDIAQDAHATCRLAQIVRVAREALDKFNAPFARDLK